MKIDQLFGEKHKKERYPYVIAEIGVNHEGNIDLAKRLVELAAEGGAHAAKFQTYKAELLTVKDSPSYWDLSQEKTKSQFELFKKYDKFWKSEYESLKLICDENGVEFLSTPFDSNSASFLNDLMPAYKISSSDITNKPFIEQISTFGKPIILSTGASDLVEINDALKWIAPSNVDVALLHCVLNYPTSNQDANLGMITGLKEAFPDLIIGYSDHTMPGDMKNLEIATILGAEIIEKHFTHDKTLKGNDHYHSMDKEDLKNFYQRLKLVLELIGTTKVTYIESEEKSRLNARRSLVTTRRLGIGDKIQLSDLTWKRPAHGISPKYIENIVGREVIADIDEDAIIKWEYLKE